jgi:MFS family permease
VFLRDRLHLSPTGVLFFACVGNLGAMSTLSLWGRVTDRYGSKPIIGLCLPGMSLTVLGWALVDPTPARMWGLASVISFGSGLFSAGLYVSTTKFELGIIPRDDRAHYVALSVMAAGISGGLSARLAGDLLERLGNLSWAVGGYAIDNFRLFFLYTFALCLIPLYLRRGLREGEVRSARSLVRDYVRQQARRLWGRVRRKLGN